ncbi:hypothetical protein VIBHAR_05697 [Vibrio campbellii ATCC BAA-1116]|uniref:Uncharacterized protein n=1 Tax=Vibrio campbellii (strain ATCC BAA-1116) TaxID=2902295 RepID=A7N8K7_VIBC1|nr:hypothetical protein VIBHAR_05697 [Vibrio campbellii ATCC BAA-1116]
MIYLCRFDKRNLSKFYEEKLNKNASLRIRLAKRFIC